MIKNITAKLEKISDAFDNFVKERTWNKYSFYLLLSFGLLALITQIYAVWHLALGESDEAYYVYFIRQQLATLSSFPLYLKPFKDSSILFLRYLNLVIILLSTILFSCSAALLFHKKLSNRKFFKFILLGICYYPLLVPQRVTVPSYIDSGYIFGILAISALLFSFSANSQTLKITCLVFSGICSTQLCFIMPPSVLLVLSVFIVTCSTGLRNAICWLAGIVSGIIFYFVAVQSPFEYWKQISEILLTKTPQDHHNAMLLIKWSAATMRSFFSGIIPFCIAMCAITEMPLKSKTTKFFLGFGVALCTLPIILLGLLRASRYTAWHLPIEILYIVFALVVWLYFKQNDKKNNIAVIILFSLSPVLFCLGTDVCFEIRSLCYVTPLIIPVFILSDKLHNKHLDFIIFLFTVIFCLHFFVQFNAVSWATGAKFFSPIQRIYKSNSNIALLPKTAASVKKIESITTQFSHLVGPSDIWQYIVLLDKKTVSSVFSHSKFDLCNLFRLNKLTKHDVVFLVRNEDCEKSYFPGWIDVYKNYFNAATTETVPVNKEISILIFR